MASSGLWTIREPSGTRSDVCDEPITSCHGAASACINACSSGISGDRPCQWSECPVWLWRMRPLRVSWTQGQTGCRCKLRNVALLTLACTIPESCRSSANGNMQQCQPSERGISKRKGASQHSSKAIHSPAPQQSRRRFRQNSRWWADVQARQEGLGTARRRETNVSKGSLAGEQKLPQPTDSDESCTGVPHREHFRQRPKTIVI